MNKEILKTDKAPAVIGAYSQAVFYGDLLFCSGQIGLDPRTGALVEGRVEAETRQAMDNLGAILNEGGLSFENILKAVIYLYHIDDFPIVDRVFGSYFEKDYPARAAIQVAGLPKGARVEIEIIAGK